MATYFGASDIQPLLDTFGVPVTVGAVTAKGIVDEEDADELADSFPRGIPPRPEGVIGKSRIVRVKTGTFTITEGGDITVDGVAYKVHGHYQEGDGAVTRVRVVKIL